MEIGQKFSLVRLGGKWGERVLAKDFQSAPGEIFDFLKVGVVFWSPFENRFYRSLGLHLGGAQGGGGESFAGDITENCNQISFF